MLGDQCPSSGGQQWPNKCQLTSEATKDEMTHCASNISHCKCMSVLHVHFGVDGARAAGDVISVVIDTGYVPRRESLDGPHLTTWRNCTLGDEKSSQPYK